MFSYIFLVHGGWEIFNIAFSRKTAESSSGSAPRCWETPSQAPPMLEPLGIGTIGADRCTHHTCIHGIYIYIYILYIYMYTCVCVSYKHMIIMFINVCDEYGFLYTRFAQLNACIPSLQPWIQDDRYLGALRISTLLHPMTHDRGTCAHHWRPCAALVWPQRWRTSWRRKTWQEIWHIVLLLV